MGLRRVNILFFTALFIASCTGSVDFLDNLEGSSESGVVLDENGKMEVVLPISGESSTRTELDPNDLASVRWSVGDQVALWADGVDSTEGNLTGEMFQLQAYNTTYDTADFMGSITPMGDQLYNYRAFYPYTSDFSGKSVNYTISQMQGGEYDGTLDFRAAKCVLGEALTDNAKYNSFSLEFAAITHILKVTIPEGYNKLGVPINQMYVTMPEGYNCVGTFSYDISNDDASPVCKSDGSNRVILDMGSETIDEGDTVWLFINPTTTPVTGNITITGIGANYEMSFDYEIPLTNHTFAAGRITPINTEICEEKIVTTLVITVPDATDSLGEPLTSVNLTAPSGSGFVFEESGSNEVKIENDGTGVYRATYITATNSDKATSLEVALESNQTLTSETSITMADVNIDVANYYDYDATYILNEDFDDLSSYEDNSNGTVGSYKFNSGDKDYIDLSTKGLSYTGWTATRSGSDGSVLRLCSRCESTAQYEGRINSPALSNLKDNAKIKVSYDLKGEYYAMDCKIIIWSANTDGSVYYQRGYFTGSDPDADNAIANMIAEDGETDIYVSDTWTSSSTYSTNSSASYEFSSTSSSTRLAWRVWGDDAPTIGNANFWLYLDNIVVKVVPLS